MNEQMLQLVRFVNAAEHRFMTIDYMPVGDGPAWEIGICLGESETCQSPHVVYGTRWLVSKSDSYQAALQKAVDKLATVRPLARRKAI